MKTLLTNTTHYDILINLDNVLYIERAADKESIIYFVSGDYARVVEDFDKLVEELHNG